MSYLYEDHVEIVEMKYIYDIGSKYILNLVFIKGVPAYERQEYNHIVLIGRLQIVFENTTSNILSNAEEFAKEPGL